MFVVPRFDRPPPLIGAVLLRMLPWNTVRKPELMMPPPPTPVVVFWLISVLEMLAVAPARLATPPPLPALFWVIVELPTFRTRKFRIANWLRLSTVPVPPDSVMFFVIVGKAVPATAGVKTL